MENTRKKIMLVDDNITNLVIGKNTLINKYDVFTIPSGKKLLNMLKKIMPDLILLDIDMPEMNGYEVIKILKANTTTMDIPVIFLTAKNDAGSELEGLSLGAVDYISKPFSPPLLLKRIDVHLLLKEQQDELKIYNENLEELVEQKTKAVLELQNAVLKTVAELVECRDDVTGGHIERTQNYLKIMTESLIKQNNLYKDEILSWNIELFILSSQLHDVGKIGIKDVILKKPSRLTNEEFEEMKKHTIFGVDIIKKIKESTSENAFLKHAEILAASHHEKWNGSGYPLGLSGTDIPLQGRLMAIADVYDALISERPYKKAFSHKDAVRIISEGKGTHFDPILIEVFLDNEKKFEQIALKSKS